MNKTAIKVTGITLASVIALGIIIYISFFSNPKPEYYLSYEWGMQREKFTALTGTDSLPRLSDRCHYFFTKNGNNLCRVVFSMDSFDKTDTPYQEYENHFQNIQKEMNKQLGKPEFRDYSDQKTKTYYSEWIKDKTLIQHRIILFIQPDERINSLHTIEYKSLELLNQEL